MELLVEACDVYGFDSIEEMFESAVCDSVAPGICKVCGYTCDIEPDATDGWCEECEQNTVVSVLILGGII
jgi:hypothetical protein